jgi:3-phosphoshikimate 1-carboxyvinyltransferase
MFVFPGFKRHFNSPKVSRSRYEGCSKVSISETAFCSLRSPALRCNPMGDVSMRAIRTPFSAVVDVPGSKSLTNRALVLAAMCDRPCRLTNVLFADDTLVMLDGLAKLGFELEIDQGQRCVVVHGQSGKVPASTVELFCGNSGTTIRFLSALCSLGKGEFRLDGIERMRSRPIGQLADLLKNLGARVSFPGQTGFPPMHIQADGLPGGLIRYPAAASSQYLSAVLMVSPYCRHEVRVDLDPNQTSWPYIWMTLRLMDQFGITPELARDPTTGEPKQIAVPAGRYSADAYPVEPDASNAMYFLAAATLHAGSTITVRGLGSASLQGDVQFAKILKQMGASVQIEKESMTVIGNCDLEAVDVSLLDMPDQAQTLGVLALFAKGQTIIRGLHTLQLKETNRLSAMATELKKFGAVVTVEGNDTLIIDPPDTVHAASVDTYDDHRMAMSFALAGTRIDGVVIKDAQCVSKTYPAYFADMDRAVMQR